MVLRLHSTRNGALAVMMRTLVTGLLWPFLLLGLARGVCAAPPDGRPNIVFLLADDLGYGDLHCYGRQNVRTPSIDRLAGEGVRFTQAYANGPECTPTRAGLLTGRYQQRVGGLECAIGRETWAATTMPAVCVRPTIWACP